MSRYGSVFSSLSRKQGSNGMLSRANSPNPLISATRLSSDSTAFCALKGKSLFTFSLVLSI